MDKKKLLEWLKANNASEEAIKFVENLKDVNLDSVKDFLEKSDEGKNFLKSHTDSTNTKAIETFKKNTMPSLIEEEIKKKFPAETEEQKRLRQLEEDNKKFQKEVVRERLLNKATTYATSKGYPIEFIERFLDEDEEKTIANVEKFGSSYLSAVGKGVEEKFKTNGRETPPPNNPPGPDYSKMTDEQYFAEKTKK